MTTKIQQRATEIGQAQAVPWAIIIQAILAAIQNCDTERAASADSGLAEVILRVKLSRELVDEGETRREAKRKARAIAAEIFALSEDDRRDCLCELREGA